MQVLKWSNFPFLDVLPYQKISKVDSSNSFRIWKISFKFLPCSWQHFPSEIKISPKKCKLLLVSNFHSVHTVSSQNVGISTLKPENLFCRDNTLVFRWCLQLGLVILVAKAILTTLAFLKKAKEFNMFLWCSGWVVAQTFVKTRPSEVKTSTSQNSGIGIHTSFIYFHSCFSTQITETPIPDLHSYLK